MDCTTVLAVGAAAAEGTISAGLAKARDITAFTHGTNDREPARWTKDRLCFQVDLEAILSELPIGSRSRLHFDVLFSASRLDPLDKCRRAIRAVALDFDGGI